VAWTLTIGIFLWIASALSPVPLQAAISGTYITTADVSLRSGPGVSYPVLTTLPRGIKIKVVGREDYWLKVESKHGDAPGYIDEQFAAPEGSTETSTTTPPPPTGAYRTLVDVELRQGPGASYPVVARLPSGIKVNVVRAQGDWLRVESKHGGKPGYLERRFVERWTEN
jgi:N-acetylmuramoyl-L-alanine amidase